MKNETIEKGLDLLRKIGTFEEKIKDLENPNNTTGLLTGGGYKQFSLTNYPDLDKVVRTTMLTYFQRKLNQLQRELLELNDDTVTTNTTKNEE